MYISRFSLIEKHGGALWNINSTQVIAFQLYWSFIMFSKKERESMQARALKPFLKTYSAAFCSNSLVLMAGNVYLCIYVVCSPVVSKHLENLISLGLIDCVRDNAIVLSVLHLLQRAYRYENEDTVRVSKISCHTGFLWYPVCIE